MKKNMSRRDFLKLAGVAGGAGVLAACQSTEPETDVPTGEMEEVSEAPPEPEDVEITFIGWGGTEEDEGVQASIEVFEAENPHIKVTWMHTPDNYNEKVMAMVASGAPPDTGFITNGNFQGYVNDGLLLDISGPLKADPVVGAKDYFIDPQETERCTRDGKWYGIGSCWVAPHIYYNAAIFEEAGIEPPSNDPEECWEWDYFLEVCKQLTIDVNGNHPGDDGFDSDNIERWAVHWPTWSIPLHAAIASNGGKWIDYDTGLITIDQPEATQALQAIADLELVHKVAPRATALEQLGMSNTQMLETEKLAMAIDGSWALSWITKIDAPLGTAALPKMKEPATDMQAHLHSAFAGTPHPDEAWEWLRFLATDFYQLGFLKIGLWLPSQTALMTPEGMQKWYTDRTAPGAGVHPAGYDKIVNDFVPKYGHVLYMPPGYTEADSLITPALDAIWVGDATAEEALKPVVPDANAILIEALED